MRHLLSLVALAALASVLPLGIATAQHSGRNTQPWRFRHGDRHMDLLADRTLPEPAVRAK